MTGPAKIGGGLSLLTATVLLGVAAKTSALTRIDVRLDAHLATIRDPTLTQGAKMATILAQPAAGVGIAVLVPVGLWLVRRRRDALISACVMIGSLAFAFLIKILLSEHRPPAWLWAISPDNEYSFPSGHATTAASMALLVILLVRRRMRLILTILGTLFALIVGFARVYLGVHYPVDVAGGYLLATGVSLVVLGLFDIPSIRRGLEDIGTPASGRHHSRHTPRTYERR